MDTATLAARIAQVQPRLLKVSPVDTLRVLNDLHFVPHENLANIGVKLAGSPSTEIYATNPNSSAGDIRLDVRGDRNIVIIDTNHRGGRINGNIRISKNDCTCILSTPDYGIASLNIVSFRSPEQCFFWGHGATAVGISVEIEGRGRSVLVGDDALISSGVWIRNHDMHSIVDLKTGAVRNAEAVDTVIEPHVWIGQDVLVLSCRQIGYGSILAAKALVRDDVPATSAIGGVPARIIRNEISWGRDPAGQSPREAALLRSCAERFGATGPEASTA